MKNLKYPKPRVGAKFGLWTVVGVEVVTDPKKRIQRSIECQCTCGTRKLVRLATLYTRLSAGCRICHGNCPNLRKIDGKALIRIYHERLNEATVTYDVFRSRIRCGWPVEKALLTPNLKHPGA